jgi:hypothetical protein
MGKFIWRSSALGPLRGVAWAIRHEGSKSPPIALAIGGLNDPIKAGRMQDQSHTFTRWLTYLSP